MTTSVRTAVLLSVLTPTLVGCGPTAPSRVPPPGPAAAPAARVVTRGGTVRNRAYVPVQGAKVEVVDGPSAGTTTTTDGGGLFLLTGDFNQAETIRVSKEGYSDKSLNFASFLEFVLEALAPPIDLRGDYTATLLADPACQGLPEELRTRTYRLTIQSGSGRFTHPSFLTDYNELATYISGNQVTFSTEFDGHPWLVERIAENSYLGVHVAGSVTVETGATTISIPVRGYIRYCENSPMSSGFLCSAGQAFPRCESTNHRLILDRR